MRQVGWAAAIGVFAIVAMSGGVTTSAFACPADNGCDDSLRLSDEGPRVKSEPEAAATQDVGAPLPLHTRKTSTRAKSQPAKQTTAATPRKQAVERDTARTTIQNAPQAVKDANAEAPHNDVADTDTKAVPIVSPDEINEIDATAAPASKIAQDTPKPEVAPEPPAAKAADVAKPQPRLALARVESTEQTENVSNSDSAWGNTSTIGKIFIAFGGFLTAASAIRMFVG
jgi:hypothetical protein